MKRTIWIMIFTMINAASLYSIDTLHTIAHFTNTPPTTTGSTMKPVALGDINADGFDDWAFRYRDRNVFLSDDSIFIYLGSDSIDFTADYKLQAREIGNIGDVNGDGYDDLAYMRVEHYPNTQILLKNPTIYILHGGDSFDLVPDDSCLIPNVEGNKKIIFEEFSKTGDINGDGYDDLVYGPKRYSGAYLTKSRSNLAYQEIVKQNIYFGNESLSWLPDASIVPPKYLLHPYSLAYNWFGRQALGDVNGDGYDDFSLQYNDISIPPTGKIIRDSVVYVYYGSDSIDNIISNVDTYFVGEIYGDLGQISEENQNSFICWHKDTLSQIPGVNVSIANDINAFSLHYNQNDIANIYPGDINNDGYNDWIIWNSVDDCIEGYLGASVLDNQVKFTTPNSFYFDGNVGIRALGERSWFYIIGDICGDGYDKVLFTERINDESYDIYCFSYNEVKTEIKEIIPEQYELISIYPNPFNPTTNIKFQLFEQVKIKIDLYNILGRKIKTIYNDVCLPGEHSLKIDGTDLNSGIYFCVIYANNKSMDVKKALLVK